MPTEPTMTLPAITADPTSVITVHLPDDHLPERRYIVETLLGERLGLPLAFVVDGLPDYRLRLASGAELVVRDHFFSRLEKDRGPTDRDLPRRIPHWPFDYAPERDLLILYGETGVSLGQRQIVLRADLFGGAFFMLSRWEEHLPGERDEHGRFPAASSVALRQGFLHRPVVDEYVELLWTMLVHLGYAAPRRDTAFCWELTCDVDQLQLWPRRRRVARTSLSVLRHTRSARAFLYTAARGAATFVLDHPDPYDSFDRLMDLAESIGVRAQFFFMVGGSTRLDAGYNLTSWTLPRAIAAINRRGHLLGFHPSYVTYNQPERWAAEFRRFQEFAPNHLRRGRQHALRFEVPTTWCIWDDHEMEFDLSLGYPDTRGSVAEPVTNSWCSTSE